MITEFYNTEVTGKLGKLQSKQKMALGLIEIGPEIMEDPSNTIKHAASIKSLSERTKE